ncbi:uncharacterized protein MELLADRAFT_104123 [Melampsora larici-populina 98AG31]|uniref:Uncharacterized protein n=1 Tax=Melampsora larici-populina (strain 98AG31 / pathotype 3-4-7) TaxID=747676 RepID=F4RDN2_MELLP|nr:uncharacterized protein MELLADRAFT_104123 [Melampsora larici-populina 98AG31]EGG09577.1 hypothetical protein MELLADRAFT_104123 [Melampsora larici-populina 98AG31]
MLSVDQTLRKIENLCNHCPGLRKGTRADMIFRCFTQSPVPDDEGMWFVANTTLDSVFGRDCIKENLSKGTVGLPLVIEWIQNARKHHSWDADSDKLIKVKLDNIVSALKDLGAVDTNPDFDEQRSGEKRQVVSTTPKTPIRPAKQPCTTSTNNSKVVVLSSDHDEPIKTVNKKTLKTPIHPAKQPQTTSSKGSTVVVLSSDHDEPIKSANKNTLKPPICPAKQPRTTSTKDLKVVVLSSDHDKPIKTVNKNTLNSDEDSDLEFIGGTFPNKPPQDPQPKQSDLLELCPLSTRGKNCTRCQVEDRLGGKELSCHCGAKPIWLNGGRVRPAKTHWDSGLFGLMINVS